MRHVHALSAVCLGLSCCALVAAQEGDRFREEREVEHLAHRMARGEIVGEEELRHAQRLLKSRLLRPDLDVAQRARYAIAQIYLDRGDAAKALGKLGEVIASSRKPDESVWVTHYNIAQICRYRLRDLDKAVQSYQAVRGNLEALAQREVLRMLETARRFDQAIAILEARLGGAQEVGERLALLTRLGDLYRRTKQDDRAIQTFEKVAKEATPDRLDGIRQQAVAQAKAAFVEIGRLRRERRWDEAERAQREIWRRWGRLRLQDRWDEARAMGRELHKLDRDLARRDEEQERAERRGPRGPEAAERERGGEEGE